MACLLIGISWIIYRVLLLPDPDQTFPKFKTLEKFDRKEERGIDVSQMFNLRYDERTFSLSTFTSYQLFQSSGLWKGFVTS